MQRATSIEFIVTTVLSKWSNQRDLLDTQWSDGQNVEWFDLIGNQPNIIPFISAYNDKKKKKGKRKIPRKDCTKIEDIYEFFAADEMLENINT